MSTSIKRAYPNLRAWRHAQQLTQMDAAKSLGVTQSHYSRLERGQSKPKASRALTITERTGVPLEVLLGAA